MILRSSPFAQLVRRLLRTPLFTAVTVVTLGLGIGANAAIFSVVYGVLLKPLPFHEPERLVGVWHRAPGMRIDTLNQSPATYFTYRELGQTFEDIGMWDTNQVTVTGRGEPERVQSLVVSDGFLPILRVNPALGRVFTKDDDRPGAPGRAMLSYGYWQRKFGAASDVVGRAVEIDGRSIEIIGVLPAGFRFLRTDPALVTPLQFDRAKVFFGNFSYQAIARLKPGIALEQANADVGRLLPAAADRFPMPPGFSKEMMRGLGLGPNVRPLAQDVIGDVGRVLWLLLGAVGLVLLIACANVANLFLVRAEGRQHELALRSALGASRGRIARELLGESLTLGLLAGAVGVGLAMAATRFLVWLAPTGLPRLEEIGVDSVVVLFTLAISVVTGLAFGVIPVLRVGGTSISALKEGGRSSSEGPQRNRARSVLVVSEIALALVLLVVSGLMIRTFVAMRQVEPGFVRPEQVQTFRIAIPEALVKDDGQVALTYRQLAERLAALPGVRGVGLTSSVTMDGNDSHDPIFVETIPHKEGALPPLRRFKWIGPGYFETMGNRLVAGRVLTWSDAEQRAEVVVISENLAREYWKEPAAALGQRIRQSPQNPWRTIVGVVGNERDEGLNADAPKIVYWPMMMRDFWDSKSFVRRTMAFVVRSERTETPSFLRELQAAVWSVNPSLPLAGLQTLGQIQAQSMAQTSFALTMIAIAGGVALLLGVVGIYGVIAYIAAQRTREIGIRIALGAEVADVTRLFLRHGLILTAAGVAIGIAASVALTRLMSALLFGVSALDPVTYAAVSLALAGVALLATYIPARRAARVDPIAALRADA
jgi:predicted permease